MVLSKHGRGRMLQRLGCREENVEKVMRKALQSPATISFRLQRKKRPGQFLRLFNGCLFVFVISYDINTKVSTIKLITVIDPKTRD